MANKPENKSVFNGDITYDPQEESLLIGGTITELGVSRPISKKSLREDFSWHKKKAWDSIVEELFS